VDITNSTTLHRRRENTFYLAATISMAIIVFIGFSGSFFLRPWFPEFEEFTAPKPVFYVHGALFAAWLMLLILQPYLIRTGNVQRHRQIGIYGAVLAGGMVLIGLRCGPAS